MHIRDRNRRAVVISCLILFSLLGRPASGSARETAEPVRATVAASGAAVHPFQVEACKKPASQPTGAPQAPHGRTLAATGAPHQRSTMVGACLALAAGIGLVLAARPVRTRRS